MKTYKLDSDFDFECTVDELLAKLTRLKEKYSEYDELGFEQNYRWDGDHSWSLVGKRKETLKEKVAREKAEKEAMDRQRKFMIANAKKLGIRPEDLL